MRARRFLPHLVFAVLVAGSLAWSVPVARALPLPDGPDDFNSPGFVVRHAWVKFAWAATRPLRASLGRDGEDARVARFFALNAQISEQARIAGDPESDPALVGRARAEETRLRALRAGIESSVERILEGRLTRVIKDAGLTRRLGGDLVWPPADIEFQDPPAVLVRSPRDAIRKESESLLDGDLPAARVDAIERRAEADGQTSALVVQVSGIAMYPAIVPPEADYRAVLQDIAHEWTHHYLFFTPLGRRYYASGKLTTLNETVADLVGRELGDLMFADYPLVTGPSFVGAAGRPGLAAPPPQVDFTREMRDLRRQVESLLAAEKVDEAERAMAEKRDFLAANGYYIRRLNQAYFAFHGSYADSAGSIDPVGPKLDDLRRRSATLRQFIEAARTLTSEAALDAALGAG